MPSYVVTGVSRGLGYEFLRQLSTNPANTVIGLSRNKASTQEKVTKDGLKNVTIVEADISDSLSLQRASQSVAKLTGGKADVLINNAALVSEISAFKTLADFDDRPDVLEDDLLESFKVNTIAVVKTINAFMPLILKGEQKKVISISTGMADLDLINDFSIEVASPYSISKGALNVAIAKYNARYKRDGVLFMGISPGYVDNNPPPAEEHQQAAGKLVQAFATYAPHFQRPLTTEESVKAVMGVVEKASLEKGDGGAFVSHLGNKQWL